MKKAKIFLTALAVLTVLGGALAFKAKTLRAFAKCNTNANPRICELDETTYRYDITPVGGKVINYDLRNNLCVFDDILGWTCTTRVVAGI